jgi:GNAT superfamily N-acetyltransferase
VRVISSERLRTLGLRTDVALERDRAIVQECEEFVAVRTPENPGYYFGNALIFDRPPQPGDDERWPSLFEQYFARYAAVRHAAFAWSVEEDAGCIEPFVQRGYTFEDRVVLTAQTIGDAPVPVGMHVRVLQSDDDWAAQLELGLATREAMHEPQAYAVFKAAQVAHQRKIAGELGAWLGAFDGDRLAGSCGIFVVEDVARYQDVGVLPDYRNRGIARSLIAKAGAYAIEQLGAPRLAIVAAADDFPRTMYERAGFTLYQREGALWISRR